MRLRAGLAGVSGGGAGRRVSGPKANLKLLANLLAKRLPAQKSGAGRPARFPRNLHDREVTTARKPLFFAVTIRCQQWRVGSSPTSGTAGFNPSDDPTTLDGMFDLEVSYPSIGQAVGDLLVDRPRRNILRRAGAGSERAA